MTAVPPDVRCHTRDVIDACVFCGEYVCERCGLGHARECAITTLVRVLEEV